MKTIDTRPHITKNIFTLLYDMSKEIFLETKRVQFLSYILEY